MGSDAPAIREVSFVSEAQAIKAEPLNLPSAWYAPPAALAAPAFISESPAFKTFTSGMSSGMGVTAWQTWTTTTSSLPAASQVSSFDVVLGGGVQGSGMTFGAAPPAAGRPLVTYIPPVNVASGPLGIIDNPEPSSWILLAGGIGAIAYLRRRSVIAR